MIVSLLSLKSVDSDAYCYSYKLKLAANVYQKADYKIH